MRSAALALVAFLLAPVASAQAPAPSPAAKPQRLALVIGNGAYKDGALPNPINDAADMAKALESSGFKVIRRACRNNPFGNRLQATAKGLAQVDAPPGTLIAFATAPGSTAADGAGRNGLYTQHLVQQIGRPGAAVEEVFKAVRAAVRAESKNLQVPWESPSLESAFAFRAAPPLP